MIKLLKYIWDYTKRILSNNIGAVTAGRSIGAKDPEGINIGAWESYGTSEAAPTSAAVAVKGGYMTTNTKFWGM